MKNNLVKIVCIFLIAIFLPACALKHADTVEDGRRIIKRAVTGVDALKNVDTVVDGGKVVTTVTKKAEPKKYADEIIKTLKKSSNKSVDKKGEHPSFYSSNTNK